MDFDADSITTDGTTLSLTTSPSAATALPTLPGSIKPKFVRVLCTTVSYIQFGSSAIASTGNSIMITPNMPEIYMVGGCSHFSAQTETGTGKVSVVPVNW